MTITNNVSNYNDVSLDIQTQFGTISQQPTANSQQPTANSQQPTANSQQVIFKVIILYFVIYILQIRAVSEFGVFSRFILWLLFLYLFGQFVMLNLFQHPDSETSSQ